MTEHRWYYTGWQSMQLPAPANPCYTINLKYIGDVLFPLIIIITT